jgi:small subunit ribosomal protein S6
MFIISPMHSSEDDVAAIVQRIQQSIEAEGGEVTSINHNAPWGRRKLAYPIRAYAGGEASRRSFTDGFYVLMHFSLSSVKVNALEYTIKYTDSILRHLITIVDEHSFSESEGESDRPRFKGDGKSQRPRDASEDGSYNDSDSDEYDDNDDDYGDENDDKDDDVRAE